MSQIQDMQAIDDLFRRTTPRNAASKAIHSSWRSWYNGLTSYHKSSSTDTYKEAVKRRDAFFKADAMTPIQPKTTAPTPSAKPMADTPIIIPGPRPTLKEGIHKTQPSTKPYVVEWQTVIKVTPDGLFGPNTKAQTIAWQKARGLSADGIVGPMTWSRAQLESTQAMATASPIAHAANAAAQQVAAAATAAEQAAAKQPTAAGKVAAVAASTVQSVAAAAAQAANVVAGKPPAPTTQSKPASKPPKPSKPSLTESASNTATQAIASVQSMTAKTPVWLKAVAVTGGVFAGLIGLKAIVGGKRRAA